MPSALVRQSDLSLIKSSTDDSHQSVIAPTDMAGSVMFDSMLVALLRFTHSTGDDRHSDGSHKVCSTLDPCISLRLDPTVWVVCAQGPVMLASDAVQCVRHLLISFCLLVTLLLPSDLSYASDSHGRLNTKHLNKLFKRFSAFVQPQTIKDSSHAMPARLDRLPDGTDKPQLPSRTVQYRQMDSNLEMGNPNDNLRVSHQIEATLTNATLAKPNPTTLSYRSMDSTSSASPAPTLSPVITTTSLPELDNSNFITAPTDQCKCVCRNGFKLETHDIRLEELRMKLLHAELLNENKSVQNMPKVEDVLDSLVDEDESDYDDIDELEQIQKPTKYIPMEIIELSHRRPPRKPNQQTGGGESSFSTSTTTMSPVLATTFEPPSTAPLYSVSFTKPVSTIKFLATRVAQLGIPLLMTVALGNALTQIELIDRSSSEDTHEQINSSNFTAPIEYWNLLQNHLAHGYYQHFDSPMPLMPNVVPAKAAKESKTWKKKKKRPAREGNGGSVLKRWIDRIRP